MAFMLIWHKSCDCVFVFQLVVHCWRPLTRRLRGLRRGPLIHGSVCVCGEGGGYTCMCACV